MIKAVILDIDGVVVGNQEGFNFPHPSAQVRAAVQKIHNSGIPVSFLTGKATFAAAENIKSVQLDNPHIADGGGTIFNPIKGEIIESKTIVAKDILQLLKTFPKIYMNLFSLERYYLGRSFKNEFSDLYSRIAGEPTVVDDLRAIAAKEPITKINIYAFNNEEKIQLAENIGPLQKKMSLQWSANPNLPGVDILVGTALGVSKRSGVESLAKHLKVSLDDVLGAGDTMHDWGFIEVCGYKAAMENASDELKAKIDVSDTKHQMIGGHVNDDGILDVFKHFKLI